MKVLRPLLVLPCAMLAFASPARAQQELFGRVLEQVTCEADPSQSYALYVPSNYAREKKWPVIFCFDPGARGKIPVERLREAAEKFGYIVAGSLNSRNGPYAANAAAIQALVKDVSAHFSLDPARIYTAGMSGGARVATALALSGLSKGVIACSAGFPVLRDGIPQRVPFVFFGTAGTEDFNYQELRRLDRELDDRRAAHRVVIFEGTHAWAPAPLLTEAVAWLELQAMRAGTRSRDEAFIQTMLQARLAAASQQSGAELWRAMKSLAADFDGLTDTSAFEQKATELGGTREVKEDLKAERALAAREDSLLEDLGNAAIGSAGQRKHFAADLRRMADAAADSEERRMARRAIASFTSMTRETVRGLLAESEHDNAAAMLEMSVLLRPDHAGTWFELARTRMLDGDRKGALAALKQAAALGFKDVARAEAEPAFARVRDDPAFEAILDDMRADPALQLPIMRVSAVLANVELRPFYLPNPGSDVLPLSFLRVETVRPGSAAALAGLAENMEITAIQNVRIRGLTGDELEELMAKPVKGEIVVVVREHSREAEKEIRIVLRKTQEPPATTTPQPTE